MRNCIWIYGPILAAICWPLDAYAAPSFFPDCAGMEKIARAHVARVEHNGALILSDGRAMVLEGIRLPLADGAPSGLTDRTLAALRELAQAEPVTFTISPPKEDRYGRIRAQAFGQSWLQVALLERGLARVAISPDREECAPDLYEAEARARAQAAGLWALPAYRVRAPAALKGGTGGFQLVEGVVSNIGQADGRTFIDFGDNGRRGLSAVRGPLDRRPLRGFAIVGLTERS